MACYRHVCAPMGESHGWPPVFAEPDRLTPRHVRWQCQSPLRNAAPDREGAGTVDAILTLSCSDRPGIVAAVAGCLAGEGADIRDSQQFGDADTGNFLMRVHIRLSLDQTLDRVREKVGRMAAEYGMD